MAVEGASHTYRLIDYDHRVIAAAVPAQSVTDIQTRTPEPREDLGSIEVGDTSALVVPQHARMAGLS